MKICTKCRSKINNNAKFCPECGEIQPIESNKKTNATKKITSRKILVVAITILLVGGLLLAIAFLFSPAEYDFSEYDDMLKKSDEVKQKFDEWNKAKDSALDWVQ